jgi:hypothetical protein
MRTMIAMTMALGALLVAAPRAEAFCGFYVNGAGSEMFNDATQVVLMRAGTRTVLSMQNNYKGAPEAFALVIPVPTVLQEADVKTLPKEVFTHVDQMGAPRLVEYWERTPATPSPSTGRAVTGVAPARREPADPGSHRRSRRDDRGAVHGRRVPDRDPVGEGRGGPRHLAAERRSTRSRRGPSPSCGPTSRRG